MTRPELTCPWCRVGQHDQCLHRLVINRGPYAGDYECACNLCRLRAAKGDET